MKFSLWRQYGALNSAPVWDAFEKSIIDKGHQIVYNTEKSDVDVIWSVLWHGRMRGNRKVWENAKKNNKPVIVIEVGGIHRGKTWRIGLNGVNGEAYFAPSGMDNSRAGQLGLQLRPWRKDGEHILICCQHERSHQWNSLPPMQKWASQQVESLRKHTDRPIAVRPHPRSSFSNLGKKYLDVWIQRPKKIKGTYDDFDLEFQSAWAVISHNSNPGPHAVIAGYPVFVGASSLAWDVGNSDYSLIESPVMPDRTQWLNDYAHTEHTLDEIRQGIPLNYLTKKLS